MTTNKLNALIVEITVDTFGDEEQLVAFLRAIRDNIPVPCAAMLIGEPIQVTKFDYDGNARRGLTAACLAANGSKLPLRSNSIGMAASLNQGTVLDGIVHIVPARLPVTQGAGCKPPRSSRWAARL